MTRRCAHESYDFVTTLHAVLEAEPVEYDEEPTFSRGYLFEVVAPEAQKGRLLHFHDCNPRWEHSLFARVGHIYLLYAASRQHSGSADFPEPEDLGSDGVEHHCRFVFRVRELR